MSCLKDPIFIQAFLKTKTDLKVLQNPVVIHVLLIALFILIEFSVFIADCKSLQSDDSIG